MALQAADGQPFVAGEGGLALLVRAASPTGQFTANPGTVSPVSTLGVVVPQGASSVSVHYRDTTAGSWVMTAAPQSPRAAQPGTALLPVLPGQPVKLSIETDPVPTGPGAVSAPIVIETQDEFGNPSPTCEGLQIRFSTSSPTGAFDLDAEGAFNGTVTFVPLECGDASEEVFYRDEELGDPVITFEENPEKGWESVSQTRPIRLTLTVLNLGSTSITEVNQDDLTTSGDLVAPSPTGTVVLGIGARTRAVKDDGSRVDLMTVDTNEDADTYGEPVNRVRVSEVLRFGPARATFDPYIAVGIRYDPASLPRGVDPKDLVIGYWNGSE